MVIRVTLEARERAEQMALMGLQGLPAPMAATALQEPAGQQDRMGHQVRPVALVLMEPPEHLD